MADTAARRDHYHHGDLHNALVEVATELARVGGPDAVVLREVARRVGVSPTAAYRHFANQTDLLRAVKHRSQARLVQSMHAELAAQPPLPDPGEDALRRLRAIGRGYLAFAMSQPGLYRCCFTNTEAVEDASSPEEFASFQLLATTLDELAALGWLAQRRRAYGEVVTWAAVHGLAMLLLDGLLYSLPSDGRDAVVERMLDLVMDGLCLRSPAGREG